MNNFVTFFKTHKIARIFILVLVWNIVLGAAYYFLYTTIQNKNQKIFLQLGTAADLNSKKTELANVKGKIIETEEIRKKIDGYFISKGGVVNFLNSIQSLGASKGLSVVVSTVDVKSYAPAPDQLESVDLDIIVSGQWSAVYNFLSMIELMPLKNTINSISIDRVENGQITSGTKTIGSSKPAWKGTMNISVLKLK